MLRAIISLAVIAGTASADPCIALAASGGGDRIAYEAGVLQGLLTGSTVIPGHTPAEVAYNVVSGISTGALLAAALRIFPIGQEAVAIGFIQQVLSTSLTSDSSVYKPWPGGFLQAFLKEQGLQDSAPLKQLVTGLVLQATNGTGVLPNYGPFTRKVSVGLVDLNTGAYETADLETNPIQDLIGSASIAGTFPPVNTGTQALVDGGLRFDVDVFGAVKACRALGATDEEITVDIVVVAPLATLAKVDTTKLKTWGIMQRGKEIEEFDLAIRDIGDALLAYPNVNFRYIVSPKDTLPGTGLEFNPEITKQQIAIGAADGQAAVAAAKRVLKCDLGTKVKCNNHRTCYNWAVVSCFPTVVTRAFCDDSSMTCKFVM